jgi:hypothetical protein
MAMDPVLIGVISACTALVASVVGPVVTLVVAKRQINANVLSANRQRWIDTLRDMLAEVVSLLASGWIITSRWQSRADMTAVAADAALLQKLERVVLVQWKIRLLLNPAEGDHQALYQAIETATARLQSDAPDVSERLRADVETIARLAQAILKREWERVKRGV